MNTTPVFVLFLHIVTARHAMKNKESSKTTYSSSPLTPASVGLPVNLVHALEDFQASAPIMQKVFSELSDDPEDINEAMTLELQTILDYHLVSSDDAYRILKKEQYKNTQ